MYIVGMRVLSVQLKLFYSLFSFFLESFNRSMLREALRETMNLLFRNTRSRVFLVISDRLHEIIKERYNLYIVLSSFAAICKEKKSSRSTNWRRDCLRSRFSWNFKTYSIITCHFFYCCYNYLVIISDSLSSYVTIFSFCREDKLSR